MGTNSFSQQGYGLATPIYNVQQPPIVSLTRGPLTSDQAQIGTLWIYNNQAWVLVSVIANIATWVPISSSPPANFFAFQTNTVTGVTGDGAAYILGSDPAGNFTVVTNVGSTLSGTGGSTNLTFTAPSTGVFLFGVNCYMQNPFAVAFLMAEMDVINTTTGITFPIVFGITWDNVNMFGGMNGSVMVPVTAGDIINWSVTGGGLVSPNVNIVGGLGTYYATYVWGFQVV